MRVGPTDAVYTSASDKGLYDRQGPNTRLYLRSMRRNQIQKISIYAGENWLEHDVTWRANEDKGGAHRLKYWRTTRLQQVKRQTIKTNRTWNTKQDKTYKERKQQHRKYEAWQTIGTMPLSQKMVPGILWLLYWHQMSLQYIVDLVFCKYLRAVTKFHFLLQPTWKAGSWSLYKKNYSSGSK